MKAHILNTTPCTVPNSIYFSAIPMKKRVSSIPKVTFGLYSVKEIHAVNTDFLSKICHYNNNLYIFAAESKNFTHLALEPVSLLGDFVTVFLISPCHGNIQGHTTLANLISMQW